MMLGEPTLVLNKNWVAIQTTTVRHAFCLLFSGAARAVHPDTFEIHDVDSWFELDVGWNEPAIETTSRRIRVPDVILLTRYSHVPRRHVSFSRRNLYRRDAHTCQYCARRLPIDQLTIDHVVPRSRGGNTSWDNCVVACGTCNRRKGNRTLAEAGLSLVRRPLAPHWTPYVQIEDHQRKPTWERFVERTSRAVLA